MNSCSYSAENCIKLLEEHGNVFISFLCFESIYTAKNGVIPMPMSGEKEVGYHAIAISSYSREGKYFKFANTWGIEWGDNGYGYLSFDYFREGFIVEMYSAIYDTKKD